MLSSGLKEAWYGMVLARPDFFNRRTGFCKRTHLRGDVFVRLDFLYILKFIFLQENFNTLD